MKLEKVMVDALGMKAAHVHLLELDQAQANAGALRVTFIIVHPVANASAAVGVSSSGSDCWGLVLSWMRCHVPVFKAFVKPMSSASPVDAPAPIVQLTEGARTSRRGGDLCCGR